MRQAERPHLDIAASSHPGISGKNNEDRFAVSSQPGGLDREPSVLAVIADGIGGHRAGEVAAEIAVETITRVVAGGEPGEPVALLEAAISAASQAIFQQSESEAEQKGMGATCACAWVIGERLYTASVGDSRIYLMRSGRIHQLTTDHTWIQEAIDQGVLTADEARGHPNAHVIRRYLGSRQAVVPDLRLRLRKGESDEQSRANQGLPLRPGDLVVLCSDGLTDLVSDEEIQETLKTQPQDQAVDALIDLANQRGGHDNITVISLQVPQAETAAVPVVAVKSAQAEPEVAQTQRIPVAAPVAKARTERSRLYLLGCLGVAGLLVLGVVLLGGLYSLLDRFNLSPQASATATATILAPLPVQSLVAASATVPVRFTPTFTPVVTFEFRQTEPAVTLTPWPTNTRAP
jgi:protein phosphatase